MSEGVSTPAALEQPQARLLAIGLTTISVLITIMWQTMIPIRKWDLWIWFVCCGVVLLSVSRFSVRHVVPLPELGLLAYPFLFDLFFQKICPTAKVASVDELLWCVDANFGYPQPALGNLLIAFPLLFWMCKVVWSSLPLHFVIVYLALPIWVRRKYILTLVVTACLILPLYALCPGAGPVYLFRDHYPYPNSLPIPLANPHRTLLPSGLLLNTTPSGHVAWALLLFWFCCMHCRKPMMIVFGGVLALTVLATLGLGEHYVIDLILSVPYAGAILALVHRRWKSFLMLMAGLVAWLVALREGWALLASPPVIWLLCLLTVAVSIPGFRPGARRPWLSGNEAAAPASAPVPAARS